jgi:hypothetical protein
MSHEQFWAWLFQLGTAGLGWPPEIVLIADMSDILLAYEGKAALAKVMSEDDDPPPLSPELLGSMARKPIE